MKKFFLYITMAVTAMAFTACDDDQSQPNGYIANTTEGSKTIVLKGFTGYQDGYSTLIPDPFTRPLYISRTEGATPQFAGAYYDFYTTTSASLEEMKLPSSEDATVWQTNVDIMPGKCYWARYYDKEVFRFMKMRVAYIEGNNVGVEYIVVSDTQERPNENKNANSDIDDEAAQLLEIPRVNTTNYFAAHYVDYDKQHIMNLAIEWNAAMRHSSWVAFSFDSTTSQDNVKRGDGWKWDPVIPAELGKVTEDDHKSDGYDKGHLCASEDRVYCKEANDQTFFYSNISPQIGSFNQKYWAKLEALIQKWGRSTQQGVFDKVYVAKGGTINKLLKDWTGKQKANDGLYPTADADGKTNPKSKNGLVVPQYYYMAILAEKDGKLQAIGFYVPHSEDLPAKPTTEDLQKYTCSIDYLEEQTGLDFFCNLMDTIEDEVEASFRLEDWQW